MPIAFRMTIPFEIRVDYHRLAYLRTSELTYFQKYLGFSLSDCPNFLEKYNFEAECMSFFTFSRIALNLSFASCSIEFLTLFLKSLSFFNAMRISGTHLGPIHIEPSSIQQKSVRIQTPYPVHNVSDSPRGTR